MNHLDCGTTEQNEQTQPKKRIRRRNLAVQLQQVLDSAQSLDDQPTNDLTIARIKLVQTRIDCLLKMQARERNDKLRQLTDDLAVAKAEIERLKSELTKARAAKPAAGSTEIELAIAQYEAEKLTGGSK